MMNIIFLIFMILFSFGCSSDTERKAENEYTKLENEWSAVMQKQPSEAISQKWISKFWQFRNQHLGSVAASKATVKVFYLSFKIRDIIGIEEKYKQMSPNDEALADADVIRIVSIASPSNDESAVWRQIVQKSSNNHVRSVAMYTLSRYYFSLNEYTKCSELLDTLSIRYNISENDSTYGINISEMRQSINSLSVGNYLPTFKTSDINGKSINLNDFKGKVVLLYFYASTCGSCVKMYPTLNRIYKKYKGDKLFLLGIAADKQSGIDKYFRTFLKRKNINWPQTLDWKLFDQYNIFSLSTIFVIDKQGKLVLISRTDKVFTSIDKFKDKSLEDIVSILTQT